MLKLTIVLSEEFDEELDEFVIKSLDIELEHSLASISKWEEIWEKPLLSTEDKTEEMNISYLQCMCLTPNVAPEVFYKLDEKQQNLISEYLDKKSTATWFSEESNSKQPRTITAELVYYWMSSFRIDWQAQYWHFNKLITLVRVFSAEQDNQSSRKRTQSRRMDIASINAQRRKDLGSSG